MTFTHDDIQSRLIEFLYGELEGDARAAFEAHVAACERCRTEVAAFQKARAVGRAAVRAGLDEEVPAGVRARILEAAATAQMSAGGAAATARAAAGAAQVVPPKDKAESAGPFAWLRARWAVPMFVTVAAMGALLLVRETIYREARKPLGESAVPPVAAPAPAESMPTPSVAAEPEHPQAGAGKTEQPAAAARVVREQPKSERRRSATANASGGGATRSAPADRAAAKTKASNQRGGSLSDSLDGLLSAAEKGRPSAKPESDSKSPAKRDLGDLGGAEMDKSSSRGFAQPPPPRAPAAPRAPAPAASKPSSAAKTVMDVDDSGESPLQLQESLQKRVPARKAAEAETAGAPAPAAAAVRAESEESAAPADAAAPLAARAEKLMATRQWADAAAAYRQLIARFPKHEQVPNWRRRLAVVEAAAARATPPPR